MSVGLIQDNNMDNMKSLEQDINNHQPSPKMNDEQKMKEEMYVCLWRDATNNYQKCLAAKYVCFVFFVYYIFFRLEVVKRKLEEAEAREEALLRRITDNEKTLNKMR